VMRRYVAFLESKASDGIVSYGLGDWFDIGSGAPGVSKLTSPGVTGTLMLYEDIAALSQIAKLLGKSDDAAKYSALASREKDLFNARFFDAKTQVYDKGSQAAQAMPLALGIVPAEARKAVLDKLVVDIHAHSDHVTTGEVGFHYLVRALLENGRSDVLLAMLLRKDAPSYGAQLAAGATSLTEAWDSKTGSQDHFMLGSGEEWFYRGLLGIDVDMSRADRLIVEPQIVSGVDWVRGSYDSAVGMVKTEWKRSGDSVEVTVSVPVKATVVLPTGAVAERVGAKSVGNGWVVGAGTWRFRVKG
jgi:alpha-L-rhamnosidase